MKKKEGLLDRDYKYFSSIVDYNYQTEYSCEESGCTSEGICRCGTIVDTEILKVDIPSLVESIYETYFGGDDLANRRDSKIRSVLYGTGKDLDIYTIDRIVRIHKAWSHDNWEIGVTGGYYGQEIDSVKLSESVKRRIESDLYTALSIDDFDQRIQFLLNLEYGYILPELESCKYSIVEVFRNEIHLGSVGHYKKVQSEDLEHYKTYDGIRGIVVPDGDKYRLIDGYHRMLATNDSYVKVIKAEK